MAQFAFKRTGDADYPRYLKILLQGPPKSGKHQANGTPVLTPSGWVPIESLSPGDHVIGSDGYPTRVLGVFPQGVKPMRRVITNDGGQTMAGDTHLWTILPHGNSVRTETTDAIAKGIASNDRYAYLPIPEPVHFDDSLLGGGHIPPYVLGLLLGDDSLHGTSTCFSKPEPDLIRALVELLPEHTISGTLADGKTVRILGMVSRIKALGLDAPSHERFIPPQYLFTTVSNRMALLAGLLDTDGGMSGKSTCFYTSSERLRDDFLSLVRSLGGVATVRTKREPAYTYKGERLIGRPAYNISLRLPIELGCPFRLTRKAVAWENSRTAKRPPVRRIVKIEPVADVESTCIMVSADDGLYVTEDYLVTHNTTFLATAPNIVVAAVEAGLMSIAHKDIPYIEVDGTDKLQTLHTVLGDPTLRAQAAKQLGLPTIDTVAIDTLDAWQEMLKREIMQENRRTQMQQADWGTLKERMSAVLKSFVALPVNVIFTVHTSTSQDDEGRLIYTPNLQGSIKDDVAGFVDFSLLAYRQRDVDERGRAKINYYLKNEGDLKNPTLGNRAAGRVPEICVPEFGILHSAVFAGMDLGSPSQNPTEVTLRTPEVLQPTAAVATPAPVVPSAVAPSAPVTPTPAPASPVPSSPTATPIAPDQAPDQAPAQNASGAEAGTAATAQPAGRPSDDAHLPVNASGVTMLSKEYLQQGLILPEDVKSWDLGKARKIAKWFVSWRTDQAEGKNPTRDDLIAYLEAFEAYAGEIPGVQTGVQNVAVPPKPPVEPPVEVNEPATPADQSPTSLDAGADQEGEAVALVQNTLGAVQIGHTVSKGALCDACGNPVDDVDVANLGLTRFRKVLCVQDYKAMGKSGN